MTRLVLNLHTAYSDVGGTGVIFNSVGKKIDPKKITAITQFPKIDTLKKCQSFLGMCAFIANFVPHFATVAAPIFNLLKDQKVKPFVIVGKYILRRQGSRYFPYEN